MPSDVVREINNVLRHYDLGELVKLEQDERGFVNTGFAIETARDGARERYFLRKYRPGIREEELQFEHSLIDHLTASGACPVARLQRTLDGKSYFLGLEGAADPQGTFYAIFDFLPGEDRYTWVDPRCTHEELASAAGVLAEFHAAVNGWRPLGRRAEPRILELLPAVAAAWATYPAHSKGTPFDAYLREHLDPVSRNIDAALAALSSPEATRLPLSVIHCDYHPGNLKFTGSQVTGLFDFDWSKVDWRAFDVGLALWYFCASWEDAQDGELMFDKAAHFLGTYQSRLQGGAGIGPLGATELRLLPVLINAANLYVLNWTLLDYFAKDVDVQEYLVFLRHGVNFARWFDTPPAREQLQSMLGGL